MPVSFLFTLTNKSPESRAAKWKEIHVLNSHECTESRALEHLSALCKLPASWWSLQGASKVCMSANRDAQLVITIVPLPTNNQPSQMAQEVHRAQALEWRHETQPSAVAWLGRTWGLS